MSDLKTFVSGVLTANGAIVEPTEPHGLEILLPKSLQQTLLLPEFCRFGFAVELPDMAASITLDSDWIERFGGLLGDNGRYLAVSYRDRSSYKPRRVQSVCWKKEWGFRMQPGGSKKRMGSKLDTC